MSYNSNTAELVDVDNAVDELCVAAYHGDTEKLQELLADPAYVNIINLSNNANKHTALFFACYGASNAEAIRILLQAGADPLQRDAAGCLPLHLAANAQDLGVITALFEVPIMSAFKLDAATDTGQTPLHALFMPGSGLGPFVKAKNADLTSSIPFFLKRDEQPLNALYAADKNGLSSLMLVKYYVMEASFAPFVPTVNAFRIFLRKVNVPGNIEDLVEKSRFAYAPQPTLGATITSRPKPRPYSTDLPK